MTQHTPTPYKVGSYGSNRLPTILTRNNTIIAICEPIKECEANAAFIVKACNAHDELVAFVKKVAEEADKVAAHRAVYKKLRDDARAIIAKVQP